MEHFLCGRRFIKCGQIWTALKDFLETKTKKFKAFHDQVEEDQYILFLFSFIWSWNNNTGWSVSSQPNKNFILYK